MASCNYDPAKRTARFFWRFQGRQFNQTIKVESDRHAEAQLERLKTTIREAERGTLIIPPGVDVKAFMLAGGVVESVSVPPKHRGTLAEVFQSYRDGLTTNSKAASSLSTERVHEKHFIRVFGGHARFADLTLSAVQSYVDQRASEGVVRVTLKKELGTLRYVWQWAHRRQLLPTPPPWRLDEITLPKGREKPPFQTLEQITRRIARGKLTAEQTAELWECLWLDKSQVVAVLDWVRDNAPVPFLHPMFAFAAYTGARRGEMVRSLRADWDWSVGVVAIRERKADSSKDFTIRNVSVHPRLAEIMRAWFAESPDSIHTIEIDEPLTIVEATKWFRRTVDGGPWAMLRGWHVFRHSLASNMAAAGVDQRIIDGVLGHSTEAMAKRYRHLLPSKQTDAIINAF